MSIDIKDFPKILKKSVEDAVKETSNRSNMQKLATSLADDIAKLKFNCSISNLCNGGGKVSYGLSQFSNADNCLIFQYFKEIDIEVCRQ